MTADHTRLGSPDIYVDAFLADSVVIADSKLYVQGAGWNVINTATLPVRHSRIGVGVLVHVPYLATNTPHVLELSLEDADANRLPIADAPVGPDAPDGKARTMRAEFNMGRPASLHPGEEQLLPLAANFDYVTFEREDQYSIVVRIDGRESRRLPFRVSLVRQLGAVAL